GIERSGERCTEPPRNRPGGATSDQDAEITAAQAEGLPKPRGDPTRELRITCFKSHRRADAARPDRLRRHDQAAPQGHTSTVKGVGLDRIDFPLATPAHNEHSRQSE